jgi:excisionase family DNA binding protein
VSTKGRRVSTDWPLSARQAWQELRDWHIPISRSAFYRAIQNGTLRAVRVCGKWYVTREELMQFRSRCEAGEEA